MKGALAVLLAGLLFAGCSLGADEEGGKGASRSEGQAAAVVVRLDALIRDRAYGQICQRLLTPRARLEAGGPACARGMRVHTLGLTDPRLRLESVRRVGGELHARVTVSSGGQPSGRRTVVLQRVGRPLRIAGIVR